VGGEGGGGPRRERLHGEAASISTEFVIRMLELGVCGSTEVGNAVRPACSPGQKKRVTTGGLFWEGKGGCKVRQGGVCRSGGKTGGMVEEAGLTRAASWKKGFGKGWKVGQQ